MLKTRLQEGHPAFGTFFKLPAPAVVEVLALSGFEFIVLDQEHGTLSHGEVEVLVRTAQGLGMEALVRVPDHTRGSILHALDSGCDGILVPMVNSAAQAAEVVAEAHYPPKGRRGLAGTRASAYGTRPAPQYLKEAAEKTLVAVQIETPEAVAAAEAIAATPGVDVLFVGPQDLSVSLGLPGENGHPKFKQATEAAYRAAKAHGKVQGTLVTSAEEAKAALDTGLRLIVWGSEMGLLGKAARETRAAWSAVTGA